MNNLVNKSKEFLTKNQTKILTGLGITAMAGATVLAVVQTPKALNAINKRKEELNLKSLPFKEIVKVSWKYYIPPLALMVGGAASIISSDKIQGKEIAGIGSALTTATAIASEYKEKLKEEVGEEKAKEIEKACLQEVVERQEMDVSDIENTANGGVLFYEVYTDKFFRSSMEAVANAYGRFKDELAEGYASVNDWRCCLGLNIVSYGYELGWNALWRGIELDINDTIRCPATGEAAIVIGLGVDPKVDYISSVKY